jgi:peptidoglycan/xylan/chitin deacetylase (PgdA/CDA1 family)
MFRHSAFAKIAVSEDVSDIKLEILVELVRTTRHNALHTVVTMSILRQRILHSYQVATHRWRTRIAEDLKTRAQMPAAILFYHRVADQTLNDWTIRNRDFRQHLDWLTLNTKLVTLQDIQLSQSSGSRKELEVAITFDDGYSDNCECAIPELIHRGIPFTYFVTTDNVENQVPFAHDVKAGKPLAVNSIAQIKQMVDRGVEIGCHTQSHPNLGLDHSREFLLREIRDARHRLQDWTGQSIDYFAFPYGMPCNVSQAAIDVVYESGFHGFVSAYGGWNWPGEDDFHLQRIHGDPGMESLTNWLTLDPRKLRRGSQIVYTKPQPGEVTTAECEALELTHV